jgi:spermidine dehydrogenase
MRRISRRDLLNGVALAIAPGLTPAAQAFANAYRYPPALFGLRGQHHGSFEVAHEIAHASNRYAIESLPIEESYDLVVVGAGISGLAAAWFFRRAVGPQPRILLIDNHDDFGGHAKRNEFVINGRLFIGYGGSQSLQSPNKFYSAVAKGLLRDLGVEVARFEAAFDRAFYASMGLSRSLFFAREAFGRDVLVRGDLLGRGPDALTARSNAGPALRELVERFPISAASKSQLVALYDETHDPLAGKSASEKIELLKRTSYRDYLTRACGCNEEVANCFQGRTLGFFGLGCDAVPAADVRAFGYPGFAGLALPVESNAAWNEPYIYHFPDGNASLARLLVRALIPGVAPGETMDDIVLAGFDYGALDRDRQNTRIRLDATCIDVRNTKDKVLVTYVRGGVAQRVEARHAVLACFHMVIPHIAPELPQPQRLALARNVKTPLVYTNVLVRNWQAWINLKVHEISAPMSFHHHVALDFPVSLGGYRHPRDPGEPILLHLAHVPGAPNSGFDARTQFRIGAAKLLGMTFEDFENVIRAELDRMLGPGGFVSARDIAAITVNRWPHGYGYVMNSLFDDDRYEDTVELARRPFGRVAIANSDAAGDAYAHLAIDQAERAVRELLRQ